MRKERTGTPYECGLCNKMFTTLGISQHLKHSHNLSSQQYYDIVNIDAKHSRCLECGDPVKFYNIIIGYTKFCSSVCSNKSTFRTSKIVKTKKLKYGEDLKPIYDKQIATNLAKSTEEKEQYIRNLSAGINKFHRNNPGYMIGKIHQTEESIKRISDSHNSRSKEDIDQSAKLREQTCLEKYGVKHVMNVPEFKEKCLDWMNDIYKMNAAVAKMEQTKIKNGTKIIYSEEELNRYKVYKSKVHSLTYKLAPKIFGEDVFDKIGLCGIDGALQIDHIVSTSFGWKNNIAPEIIACEHNLQLLPWKENRDKFTDCHMDHKELISLYEESIR